MRRTSETLLISAIINNPDDRFLYQKFNIAPEHFIGHQEEFEWVVNYIERIDEVPSAEEVLARFPDFRYSENQVQMAYQAADILEAAAKRELKRKMSDAAYELESGHVASAYSMLGLDAPTVSAAPISLLDDTTIFDRYNEERDTINLPWDALQGYTDGIGPAELWYIAARPAQGKSYTLLNIAAEAVLQGRKVIIYSLEMTQLQVQQRMHVILAQMLGLGPVSHTSIRRRNMDLLSYKKLHRDIRDRVKGDFWVITPAEARVTPALIASKADDFDLSLVDYIGLMHTNEGKASIEDWRIAAQISNELRAVSLGKKCRIIAAAQISRDGDKRWGQMAPKLSQLAQTDALGQDGDVVITMNRYARGALAYSLEKNRHGESYVSWFSKFDPEYGDFEQITRNKADSILDSEQSEFDV